MFKCPTCFTHSFGGLHVRRGACLNSHRHLMVVMASCHDSTSARGQLACMSDHGVIMVDTQLCLWLVRLVLMLVLFEGLRVLRPGPSIQIHSQPHTRSTNLPTPRPSLTGLTMVVGPPGTGKTDTAVQILQVGEGGCGGAMVGWRCVRVRGLKWMQLLQGYRGVSWDRGRGGGVNAYSESGVSDALMS